MAGVMHGGRRFWGDLFGSKWGVKINESAEDTVVVLSQFSGCDVALFDVNAFVL